MEEKTIMLLAVLLVGVAVVMGMKSDSGKQKSFAKKIPTHLKEEGFKKKKKKEANIKQTSPSPKYPSRLISFTPVPYSPLQDLHKFSSL